MGVNCCSPESFVSAGQLNRPTRSGFSNKGCERRWRGGGGGSDVRGDAEGEGAAPPPPPLPRPTPFPPAQSRLIKSSLPLSFSPSLSYQPESSAYCKPPGRAQRRAGWAGGGVYWGGGGASGNDANSGPVGRLLEELALVGLFRSSLIISV